jgi:hypothetical protein
MKANGFFIPLEVSGFVGAYVRKDLLIYFGAQFMSGQVTSRLFWK